MATAIEIKDIMATAIRKTEGRKHNFEMTVDEFIDNRVAAEVRNYERSIEHEKQYLESIKDKARPKEKEKIEWKLQMWANQLDRLRSGEWKKVNTNYLNEQYAKMVKKAISTGQPVPQHIIDQSPVFKAAQTARERYEKGWKTSFANRSVAINEQMKEELGYKVKRQDGTPITSAQIDEIAQGIGEVESAIGPLHDLFDKTDITIVHTSGKHPFLSGFGGLYHSSEKSVNIGVDRVKALGHELGHWLDFESGKADNLSSRIYSSTGKGREITSTAEAWEARYKDQRETELGQLIRNARDKINKFYEVRQYMKADYGKDKSAEEKEEMKLVRERLSAYWREPREIWARLVEQYIATKRGKGGQATDPPDQYEKRPGWWTKEDFATMMPQVEKLVRARIRTLRGSDVVPPRKKASAEAKLESLADDVKKIEKESPIPKAAPGQPEAGLQPDIFGGKTPKPVMPLGKGKAVTASMDAFTVLQAAREAQAAEAAKAKAAPTYENIKSGQTLIDEAGDKWLVTAIDKKGVPAAWAVTIKGETIDLTRTRPLTDIERYYKVEVAEKPGEVKTMDQAGGHELRARKGVATKAREKKFFDRLEKHFEEKDIVQQIDALVAIGKERMMKSDPAIRGIHPAEADWLTDDERDKLTKLQAQLPRTSASEAQARVKAKREARIKAREAGAMTRDQLIERFKKISKTRPADMIDYVAGLTAAEVDDLYKRKDEITEIGKKKYWNTSLALAKAELENYIAGAKAHPEAIKAFQEKEKTKPTTTAPASKEAKAKAAIKPSAEPVTMTGKSEPEAMKGIMGSLSHEDAAELLAGLDLRTESLGNRIYEGQATLEAIKETLNPDIARLTELIPATKEGKGEITHITKGQYRKVWGREPKPVILTKDGKRVRWEYALDEIAQQLHLESKAQAEGKAPDEYLKDLIEQAKDTKELMRATQIEIASDEATLKALGKLKDTIKGREAEKTAGPLLQKLAHPRIKKTAKPRPATRAKAMLAEDARALIERVQSNRTRMAIILDNSLLANRIIPISKAQVWAKNPNRMDIRGVDTPGRGSKRIKPGVAYADKGKQRLSRTKHRGFQKIKLG